MLGVTMPEFKIIDEEQIGAARRLHERMKPLVARTRLAPLRLPEGFGFNLSGRTEEFCVVMGSRVFHVLNNPDLLCVTLEERFVQLKFDFTRPVISVRTRDLRDAGTPQHVHRSRSVSYANA